MALRVDCKAFVLIYLSELTDFFSISILEL